MDRRGSKRTRTIRHQGYVLVMMHADEDLKGVNKVSYCIETKKATLTLSLALFGTNLKYKRGATLPPRDAGVPSTHEFDIVTRTYVDRATSPTWTEARAVSLPAVPACSPAPTPAPSARPFACACLT